LSRERVGGEIMRMLGLAKIVRTLGQMSEIGLLSLDEPALLALTAYERLGGQAPETRLALIAGDDLDAAQSDWRLSNEQLNTARAITKAAALLDEDRIGEAAYRHSEAAVEGLA